MSVKIAFFDAKPYDRDIFNEVNSDYGYDIKYFRFNLTSDNAILSDCADVVCVFVNDMISSEVIDKIHECGVKLIALRCSGYNNVDLKAAANKIQVARVAASVTETRNQTTTR